VSTVKATNFQHPSSAAANITLGSDGSVVLPAGFSGGLGTNVVQAVKTDTFSASLAVGAVSGDVTGLTVSITPSSATAKVLVIASIYTSGDGGAIGSYLYLYRDGSLTTYIGDAASSRARVTSSTSWEGQNNPDVQHVMFLDSPATTSAVTYSVRLGHDRTAAGTSTVYVNRGTTDTDANYTARTASSITAIEVAA
jgi:hypothetical protein